MLYSAGQKEWCTGVCLGGLLTLITHFATHHTKSGIACSADRAHQYISKHGRAKLPTTIKEPLRLLVHIRVLCLVRKAVNGPDVKISASYRISDEGLERASKLLQADLSPNIRRKRMEAECRKEARLQKKQPWRCKLFKDLNSLSFSYRGQEIASYLLSKPNFKNAVCNTAQAMDGKNHYIKTNQVGQISTSIHGCPKELKTNLTLYGSEVEVCDITNAHWCFLPRLLSDRICYLFKQEAAVSKIHALWEELAELGRVLSTSDLYSRWCDDPSSIEQRSDMKRLLPKKVTKRDTLTRERSQRCWSVNLFRALHVPVARPGARRPSERGTALRGYRSRRGCAG